MGDHSDGLDALLQELSMQQSAPIEGKQRSEKSARNGAVVAVEASAGDDGWDWDGEEEEQEQTKVVSDQVKRIAEQLRSYIHDVADSDVR